MMKKILLLFAAWGCIRSVAAQDLIVKRDASQIEARVTEIAPEVVRYKRFSNPDGPTYVLPVAEIDFIRFANGEVERFGQEAVDTLLKAMEDHRSEFVVIVAGYTDLMEEFLSSNPGLKSRFNKFIHFGDYSAEELLAILESMCAKQEYTLSDEARARAGEIFLKRVKNKPDNFANARDVRNFLEHAIANHASRVVNEKNVDKSMLSTLEAADLQDFS